MPTNPSGEPPSSARPTQADPIERRKEEHLSLALSANVEPATGSGWDDVTLVHEALPELDLDEVDLSVELLGRTLSMPLLIAGMTGGYAGATTINGRLACVAERCGIAIGVGSQRAGLLDPSLEPTYAVVREQAPTALVIGNIGAGQLIPQRSAGALTIDQIEHAIAMIGADALAVHLNVVEELVQSEGDRRTRGCIEAVGRLVEALDVPVILKETGAGLSHSTAVRIAELGVQTVDVGGLGGTSFAMVERLRAQARNDRLSDELGADLREWGIPTAVAVPWAHAAGLIVIATGGIRSGLHAAKALALGASAVGVARPLLGAARESEARALAWIERFERTLRAVLMLTGSPNVATLQQRPVILSGKVRAWLDGARVGTAAHSQPPADPDR